MQMLRPPTPLPKKRENSSHPINPFATIFEIQIGPIDTYPPSPRNWKEIKEEGKETLPQRALTCKQGQEKLGDKNNSYGS